MPNSVQNPRWIRDLREACNLVGAPSLSLDETITPVIVLPTASPESVRTSCWGMATAAAVAGVCADLQILNPVGSGVITSITSMSILPGPANAQWQIDVLENPGTVGFSPHNVNAGVLDSRFIGDIAAPAGVGGQACVTGGGQSGAVGPNRWHVFVPPGAPGAASVPIQVKAVITEGFVFRLRSTTTNQAGSASFFWEEMPNTAVVR
jgi:hypothetical protein